MRKEQFLSSGAGHTGVPFCLHGTPLGKVFPII